MQTRNDRHGDEKYAAHVRLVPRLASCTRGREYKKEPSGSPAALEFASPLWRGGYRRREPDLLL